MCSNVVIIMVVVAAKELFRHSSINVYWKISMVLVVVVVVVVR